MACGRTLQMEQARLLHRIWQRHQWRVKSLRQDQYQSLQVRALPGRWLEIRRAKMILCVILLISSDQPVHLLHPHLCPTLSPPTQQEHLVQVARHLPVLEQEQERRRRRRLRSSILSSPPKDPTLSFRRETHPSWKLVSPPWATPMQRPI